jgi:hypothetical protein
MDPAELLSAINTNTDTVMATARWFREEPAELDILIEPG